MADFITTTEDAIISRIKQLFGNKLRAVDSLPGELNEEILKEILIQAPAVYVAFTGGTPGNIDDANIEARWVVFPVTGHASGQKARRHGDAVQIGANEITCRLTAGLHNHVVPDTGTLKLRNISIIFSGALDRQGCTIYGLTFGLPMQFEDADLLAGLDDFITFHADYDLAQKDGQVEAADNATLEQ